MARLIRERVTYQLPGGRRQTRNVEYRNQGGDPNKNAAVVQDILAAEHGVRPEQVRLYLGNELPPEPPKAPVNDREIERLSKADMVEIAIKEDIEVDAAGSAGRVREQLKAGLSRKYSATK